MYFLKNVGFLLNTREKKVLNSSKSNIFLLKKMNTRTNSQPTLFDTPKKRKPKT